MSSTSNPITFTEIRETVREIIVPVPVQEELPLAPAPAARKPPLFAEAGDDELLSYGVPAEWLADVKQADEDSLLSLAGHLPAEAAEALLELATAGRPRIVRVEGARPFEHPDAQRRFRIIKNPKTGIQADFIVMRPQHIDAKGVQSGNLCSVQQR